MSERVTLGRLQVAANLKRFVEDEVLPGTGIDAAAFWSGLDQLAHDLAPKNRALLAERDRLQLELDAWHKANPGPIQDMAAYRTFLESIGYLLPVPGEVKIDTANVDIEIATQAGPQLVVPIMNARYALNAANARWGSLYDALYGTDAISEEGGAQKGRATTKSVAPRSSPTRATCSTRPRRWLKAATPTPPPTACRTVSSR